MRVLVFCSLLLPMIALSHAKNVATNTPVPTASPPPTNSSGPVCSTTGSWTSLYANQVYTFTFQDLGNEEEDFAMCWYYNGATTPESGCQTRWTGSSTINVYFFLMLNVTGCSESASSLTMKSCISCHDNFTSGLRISFDQTCSLMTLDGDFLGQGTLTFQRTDSACDPFSSSSNRGFWSEWWWVIVLVVAASIIAGLLAVLVGVFLMVRGRRKFEQVL